MPSSFLRTARPTRWTRERRWRYGNLAIVRQSPATQADVLIVWVHLYRLHVAGTHILIRVPSDPEHAA